MKKHGALRHSVARVLILASLCMLMLLPLAGAMDTRASPEAYFTYTPSSPVKGENVTFDATRSSGTSPLNYSWTFGDGEKGTGRVVNHVYEDSGYYVVYLEVTDGSGDSDITSQSIHVYDSEDIVGPAIFFGIIAFYGVCLIVEVIILILMMVIWIINIIFLIVHFTKMNKICSELGSPQELDIYKIVLLVVGIIGIVLTSFVVPALIAQFIVFYLFKGKADEIRKRGRRPQPGQVPNPPYARGPPPPTKGQPVRKKR